MILRYFAWLETLVFIVMHMYMTLFSLCPTTTTTTTTTPPPPTPPPDTLQIINRPKKLALLYMLTIHNAWILAASEGYIYL